MADTKETAKETASSDETPALLLAEFETTGDLLHAANKVRQAGYKHWDTHSPFPIHGMDTAMGLPDSKLGAIVFPIGLTGTSLAFLMMWWMNGVDYPLVIGGKPPYSFWSMVPIMFELTVLLSAFATVIGMFHLNRLPRHHHPIFNSERFSGFSDDKFFLSIEAIDPSVSARGGLEKAKKVLESCHPTNIEVVYDDDEGGADFEGGSEHEAHA
jgi:ActD protein